MRRSFEAIRRINLRTVDGLVALALMVDLVLEATLSHGIPRSDRLATAVVGVPFGATVAVRRRWPGGALIACALVALAQGPFHGQLFGNLPSQSAALVPILVCYGSGAWLELRRSVVFVAVAGLLLYADMLVETYVTHVAGVGGWSAGLEFVLTLCLGPWAVGRFMRERHRRAEAFALLERQAAAERAERTRAAISEERILIGRELQDIIAHSVSVMVVQAGGARTLLRSEPGRARESLLTVEQTGREALAEMRLLLGVLRRDDDPRALAPQPGLEQLPELAELIGRRGLACEIHRDGMPALTPGVDLVAYRVIEAALTGAAAHGGEHARVVIGARSRALTLEVAVDQVGPDGAAEVRAVGERVALYDGRLAVDDADGAGLRVLCELPLNAPLPA
jgi:signal transduction histidine kinase